MPGPNHTDLHHDLLQARAGDRAAFGRVMDACLPLAFRLADRWLASPEDAKDVCQDAFIRVWEHLPGYDPDRPFEGWLTTIVTRLCFDRLRRERRWNIRRFLGSPDPADEPAAIDPSPALLSEHRDLESVIVHAARRLPPTQRIVFALRDLEDLDVDEVVAATGLSTASVKTNLSYARRTLRTILKDEFQLEKETA